MLTKLASNRTIDWIWWDFLKSHIFEDRTDFYV
jgi:hypothetical protein